MTPTNSTATAKVVQSLGSFLAMILVAVCAVVNVPGFQWNISGAKQVALVVAATVAMYCLKNPGNILNELDLTKRLGPAVGGVAETYITSEIPALTAKLKTDVPAAVLALPGMQMHISTADLAAALSAANIKVMAPAPAAPPKPVAPAGAV